MQEKILLFFQAIATPALDKAAQFITMMGEEMFVIGCILAIYWCVDKKRGMVISVNLIASLVCMSALKAIIRQPRPFTVLDSVQGKRIETATGYSFPSGHTTTAASFYSSVAFFFRKKGLSIICAVMILLVGLSRIYLGVHWPLDVAGGLFLGITMTAALSQALWKLLSDEAKTRIFAVIVGSIALCAGLAMGILVDSGLADPISFTDFAKTMGYVGGAFMGFLLEEKVCRFGVDGDFREKFFRFLTGILSLILIRAGLKAVMPSMVFFSWLRYVITGLWLFGFYPLIGVRLRLFRKAEEKGAKALDA